MSDLSGICMFGSIVCACLGVIVFAMIYIRTLQIREAVPFALDLWLAAGLLKLSAHSEWTSILTALLVVIVRKLAVLGLGHLPPRKT